jgi:hypothetical protein
MTEGSARVVRPSTTSVINLAVTREFEQTAGGAKVITSLIMIAGGLGTIDATAPPRFFAPLALRFSSAAPGTRLAAARMVPAPTLKFDFDSGAAR